MNQYKIKPCLFYSTNNAKEILENIHSTEYKQILNSCNVLVDESNVRLSISKRNKRENGKIIFNRNYINKIIKFNLQSIYNWKIEKKSDHKLYSIDFYKNKVAIECQLSKGYENDIYVKSKYFNSTLSDVFVVIVPTKNLFDKHISFGGRDPYFEKIQERIEKDQKMYNIPFPDTPVYIIGLDIDVVNCFQSPKGALARFSVKK